jgi:hypothetical protein
MLRFSASNALYVRLAEVGWPVSLKAFTAHRLSTSGAHRLAIRLLADNTLALRLPDLLMSRIA